ncbi:Hypothetical protein ABZS17I87_02880 [Kosakonia cowanii]
MGLPRFYQHVMNASAGQLFGYMYPFMRSNSTFFTTKM